MGCQIYAQRIIRKCRKLTSTNYHVRKSNIDEIPCDGRYEVLKRKGVMVLMNIISTDRLKSIFFDAKYTATTAGPIVPLPLLTIKWHPLPIRVPLFPLQPEQNRCHPWRFVLVHNVSFPKYSACYLLFIYTHPSVFSNNVMSRWRAR